MTTNQPLSLCILQSTSDSGHLPRAPAACEPEVAALALSLPVAAVGTAAAAAAAAAAASASPLYCPLGHYWADGGDGQESGGAVTV